MDNNYKYGGVFCTGYIPWAGLLIVAGISLYDKNIYFSIAALLFFVITIALLIRCKVRSPGHIVEIANNQITINLPGNIKSISVNSIESIELKPNKLIVNLKDSSPIEIPSSYWPTTSDMKHFINNAKEILPNN